jgi:YggT family protein
MLTVYLTNFIVVFFNLWAYLLIIYVILSLVSQETLSKMTFLLSLVAPVLRVIRRVIPPVAGMDFSPLIAIIAMDTMKFLLLLLVGKL